MRTIHTHTLGLALAATLLGAFSLHAAPAQVPGDMALTPGRLIVKLVPGANLTRIAERHHVQLTEERATLLGWDIVQVARLDGTPLTARETQDVAVEVAHDADIIDLTVDRIYQPLAIPNDPGYDQMWHLNAIGAATTWDTTTGLATQRIGVVDTGTLRNHEDLLDKAVAGWDFISDANRAGDGNGRDADYNDEGDGANCGFGFQDDSWHGSHVAGTILATTNNNQGIAGLNWEAKLVTARALGQCGGNLVDIMEGAAWLVGASIDGVDPLAVEDRVSVMNLSLGGAGGCSGFEQNVVDFILDQGVIMVAAAGNDGGPVGSPANCGGVITVAASGPTGGLANYSSFGSQVEIVAPGGQMFNQQSQGVLSASGPGNSDYAWQQGTSMASPHVTGAVSLLQAIDPTLTTFEIVDLFTASGDSCAGCSGKPALRLDLAMALLVDGALPPPPEDDEFAGNNSPADAAALACDTSYDLFMIAGGEDWFTIEAEDGDIVTVDVAAQGAFDLDLYVTTGQGSNEVGRSTSPTGTESVQVAAPGAGTLEVSVLSYDGAQGAYTLGLACENLDDEFEPNDSPDAATPLMCNTSHALFMAPSDRDWFSLQVDPGEPFEVNIEAQGAFDLDLYVTTGPTTDDVVAESTTPEGVEVVTFTRDQQELWAAVVPWQDATGPYTISLDCPNREVIEPEPEPEVIVEPEAEPEQEPETDITEPEPEVGIVRTPPDPTDTGWGCAQSGGSSSVLFGLLALGGLARRRRRD